MKRVVCAVVLFSMMAHCASRIGIIAYLYSNRYEIAYCLGLIDEEPIAMCDAGYFSGKAPLAIADDDDTQYPGQFPHAREIVLFFQVAVPNVSSTLTGLTLTHNTPLWEVPYDAEVPGIFHPPCQA